MKKFLPMLTMMLIVMMTCSTFVYAANEKEDNDSYEKATNVRVNEEIYGNINEKKDVDWYCVELPENGRVTIQVGHSVIASTYSYWDVNLYKSDGTTEIGGWDVAGNSDLKTADLGLPAGKYFVRVRYDYDSSRYSDLPYTLIINHETSSVWEKEINDSIENATSINVNNDYYGSIHKKYDTDWYTFSVAKDGYITLQFDHPVIASTDAYWDVNLYKSDAVTEICAWNVSGNLNMETAEIGLPTGTYTIRVRYNYDYSRYSTETYLIRVNHTMSSVWEKELNGSYNSADEIPLNTEFYGSVCNKYDVDWYKVTTPKNGHCSIEFKHPVIASTDAYWDMHIYQSDGVTPIYGEDIYWPISGNEDTKTMDIGLPQGTYYIRVRYNYNYGRYSTLTYAIKTNFASSSVWEKEINGSANTATEISVNKDYYGSTGLHDKDWYSFSLENKDAVSIVFSHGSNGETDTYWVMHLYKSDGATNIATWNWEGNFSGQTKAIDLSTGKYYVSIEPYSSSRYSSSTYTLCVNSKANNTVVTPSDDELKPIDDFVSRLYKNFLGRSAKKDEVRAWSMPLAQNSTTGAKVVYKFVYSEEFQANPLDNAAFVTAMYETILGRKPDQSGLNSWINILDNGCTRKKVLAGFLNSDEMRKLYSDIGIESGSYNSDEVVDKNSKVTFFVARMYRCCLGRDADYDGLTSWVSALLDKRATGTKIATGFFFSPEMKNMGLSNRQFVENAYIALLDRQPDTAGWNSWTQALDKTGDRNKIVQGFVKSVEFGNLCEEYGINR